MVVLSVRGEELVVVVGKSGISYGNKYVNFGKGKFMLVCLFYLWIYWVRIGVIREGGWLIFIE